MTTAKRAAKGGEIGMNGERYEGGQFLPSTTLPKRGSKPGKATGRKVEIEPYKWVTEREDFRPLNIYGGVFFTIRNGKAVDCASDQTLNYYNRSRGFVTDIVNRWNNGERWEAI